MLRIRAVQPLLNNWLRLTLTDGSVVDRDVTNLLRGPVFEVLRADPDRFREVRVSGGTVIWPDGLDLDPDVLIWGGPANDAAAARPARSLRLDPVRT